VTKPGIFFSCFSLFCVLVFLCLVDVYLIDFVEVDCFCVSLGLLHYFVVVCPGFDCFLGT